MLVIFAVAALLWIPTEGILTKVKPMLCFDGKDPGNGDGRFQSFYYDSGFGKCEKFYFRGSGGNANRFGSLAACQRKCTDVCRLPIKVGPCEAATPAFFYDATIGKCRQFIFGGCEPNANNFGTLEECRRRCPDINPVCMEEPYSGNSESIEKATLRYSFSAQVWRCRSFFYSGEGGNNNNFASSKECRENCPLRDICRFPVDVGPCERYTRRWHYDLLSDQCLFFQYGGCLGNKNNFRTKEECESRCPEKVPIGTPPPRAGSAITETTEKPNICDLPKAGEVEASETKLETQDRYFYDKKTKSCKYFLYGGRGGNANNFRSVEECNLFCPIKNQCAEPRDHGTGSASLKQWYYDLSSGTCRPFIYNGEGGNRNRFLMKSLCQEQCIGCAEKAERGPCLGFQNRYFYNKNKNDCETFIYGGCKGNRNRFLSKRECYRRCQ